VVPHRGRRFGDAVNSVAKKARKPRQVANQRLRVSRIFDLSRLLYRLKSSRRLPADIKLHVHFKSVEIEVIGAAIDGVML